MASFVNPPHEQYYHMRVIYKSGGKTSYYYEVNKPKEVVEYIIFQIETLVPAIRFDGHRIYPKRISEYKIFVTESPFEGSSENLKIQYLNGYRGDFGGDDITLRGLSLSDSVSNTSGVVRTNIENMIEELEPESMTPEIQSKIDEVNAQLTAIGDMAARIEEQTAPLTLRERIENNIWDYIITWVLGFIGAGIMKVLFFS